MIEIRAARPDDLAGVVAVMNAVDVATLGEPDTSEDDIRSGWEESGFALEQDALVADADGRIVGYGEVYAREGDVYDVDVYADPATPGVLDELFPAVRRRAERAGAGAVLSTWLPLDDPRAPHYASAGFQPVRRFQRMRCEVEAAQPVPREVEGIRFGTARKGVDEPAVHDVLVEAFAGHVRPMTTSWERFAEQNVHHPDFDPDLWGVAWDGERVVGAMTLFDHGDLAFLRHIGVRDAYRGRGIASALIERGLVALAHRGQTRLDLGVDVDDAVGAAAIYERLGFRALQRLQLVERRL